MILRRVTKRLSNQLKVDFRLDRKIQYLSDNVTLMRFWLIAYSHFVLSTAADIKHKLRKCPVHRF